MLRQFKHALMDHFEDTGQRQWQVAQKCKRSANWLSLVVKERICPTDSEKKTLGEILKKPVEELFPEKKEGEVAEPQAG